MAPKKICCKKQISEYNKHMKWSSIKGDVITNSYSALIGLPTSDRLSTDPPSSLFCLLL